MREERKHPDEVWFHKYRIIKLLGTGGNSEVYLAEHFRLGCFRAVKRIARNAAVYEQFMNEANILKNLKHPCIPVIYDIEEDDTYSYIIEEYIEGSSLKAYRLNHNRITEKMVIDFSIQICSLLQYLHVKETPVFYLDLKPENIIVDGITLKLVDFGAASYQEHIAGKKYFQGTAGYAAPELYKGVYPDQRTDIYSIGMLIYFLVSGREGFDPEQEHIDFAVQLSPGLRKIAGKCLRHYPAQRYQTITQLERKLRRLRRKHVPGEERSVSSLDRNMVIAVAGSQHRIGTTHMVHVIAGWFNHMGCHAVYRTKEEVVQQDDAAAIIDMGVLNSDNLDMFTSAAVRIVIAGSKEGEWGETCRCMDLLYEYPDIYYLFNYIDGRTFLQIQKQTGTKRCMRIPWQPDPGRAADNNGMKRLMEELFDRPPALRDRRHRCRTRNRRRTGNKDSIYYVIGLAGAHPGAGVTHGMLALAAYTSEELGRRTACIERSGHNDFNYLNPPYCSKSEEGDGLGCFTVSGIDFYPNVEEKDLEVILDGSYQYYIIDFGIQLGKIKKELENCNKTLVFCSMSEWKRDYLPAFLNRWEHEYPVLEWIYLTAFGRRGPAIHPMKEKDIIVRHIGYLPNPFVVPECAKEVFRSIL